MICLMMISSVYSQTPSNDNCIVPCISLKNALKLKVKYDYCYNQLKIARDSISLLDSVNCQQDTIILNKNQEIILLEDNVKQIKKIEGKAKKITNYIKKHPNSTFSDDDGNSINQTPGKKGLKIIPIKESTRIAFSGIFEIE